ncbi:1-deoxy-D-xylulose-5-phosphate reductoisomerase [Zhongshania aliphaticivorans]|uniref:1-deoxy-D-xylulose-5-phosphate reductoisomerase n=1 Tax=Zhongshania aliphaticivorans TaxID=1470434 RepID=UPI0012E5C74F|nr:1-deoxy-D-xylulose 5-phosphate reductoisomerase [Zhongshania aliphaticivorans]
MQSVTVLGSTGSVGASTLDVLARHPDRYSVYALTANHSVDVLFAQVEMFSPRYAVLADATLTQAFAARLAGAGLSTEVLSGEAGLCAVAREADVTMAAIVGAAGLVPTMAAVEAGKKVLLANKEALVMAGPLFMDAVERHGATLLPIDSEHNAIFQCLPSRSQTDGRAENPFSNGVQRILLTGSGGPFRTTPLEDLRSVSPDQACAHPNWSMGRKISVDSATMMNKGLELIEACWLFHTDASKIDIIVHPQSVIHSMVEYIDGSVLAQLGNPDMRTPIAHALAWPERIASGVGGLDIITQARLDFEAPDEQRFPCLRLAREAAIRGGTAPAVLNAANELAVEAFLDGRLSFIHIAVVIEEVMLKVAIVEPQSLADVQHADNKSRRCAMEIISHKTST